MVIIPLLHELCTRGDFKLNSAPAYLFSRFGVGGTYLNSSRMQFEYLVAYTAGEMQPLVAAVVARATILGGDKVRGMGCRWLEMGLGMHGGLG